jgi:hypothetical protein
MLILDSLLSPPGPRALRLDGVKDFHVVPKSAALHCAATGAWTHPVTNKVHQAGSIPAYTAGTETEASSAAAPAAPPAAAAATTDALGLVGRLRGGDGRARVDASPPFEVLTDDLVARVGSFLDIKTLGSFSLVSRRCRGCSLSSAKVTLVRRGEVVSADGSPLWQLFVSDWTARVNAYPLAVRARAVSYAQAAGWTARLEMRRVAPSALSSFEIDEQAAGDDDEPSTTETSRLPLLPFNEQLQVSRSADAAALATFDLPPNAVTLCFPKSGVGWVPPDMWQRGWEPGRAFVKTTAQSPPGALRTGRFDFIYANEWDSRHDWVSLDYDIRVRNGSTSGAPFDKEAAHGSYFQVRSVIVLTVPPCAVGKVPI